MKRASVSAAVLLIVGSGLALLFARGQQSAEVTTDNRPAAPTAAGIQTGAGPRETATVVADVPIPNVSGKRLVSRVIEYPPAGGSAPHRHARTAFIYAYVLSGRIRSQVDGQPARVYGPGETWFEDPGAHHRVSENASDTEPARLLAVLIVDAAAGQLTIPDRQ
jgi:quercetin dioxygenase-like cupin family protein